MILVLVEVDGYNKRAMFMESMPGLIIELRSTRYGGPGSP